ncbi:hypothetical protein [Planctomicrobium sp. SH527]
MHWEHQQRMQLWDSTPSLLDFQQFRDLQEVANPQFSRVESKDSFDDRI